MFNLVLASDEDTEAAYFSGELEQEYRDAVSEAIDYWRDADA